MMKAVRIIQAGFQLLEMMIAVAIVAVLLMIATASYSQYRDRVDNATAAADISMISQAIERFYVVNNRFPDSLAEIGMNGLRDPWGNPYSYLRINGGGLNGVGGVRKDKNLVPINSDYDLYSKGKDGDSVMPLTAKHSRDDIIRANNGKFIGLAADY